LPALPPRSRRQSVRSPAERSSAPREHAALDDGAHRDHLRTGVGTLALRLSDPESDGVGALAVEEIGGWGRRPVRSGRVVRPERLVLPSSVGSLLPRGLGRAYGDAAVPTSAESLVIETAHADRILDF